MIEINLQIVDTTMIECWNLIFQILTVCDQRVSNKFVAGYEEFMREPARKRRGRLPIDPELMPITCLIPDRRRRTHRGNQVSFCADEQHALAD